MSTSIDRQRLQELLAQGAQLVEALPTADYAEAHLPEAISLPLKGLTRQAASALDRSRPIIVYCNDFQ
jgi:rhodanese-related sulfurtransferase